MRPRRKGRKGRKGTSHEPNTIDVSHLLAPRRRPPWLPRVAAAACPPGATLRAQRRPSGSDDDVTAVPRTAHRARGGGARRGADHPVPGARGGGRRRHRADPRTRNAPAPTRWSRIARVWRWAS
jgi:hypothetical protein